MQPDNEGSIFVHLQEAAQLPLKDKLKNFLEACAKFQPVMRYFFMEKFSQPSVWFERRLAYTKSVSTTSIGSTSIVVLERLKYGLHVRMSCNGKNYN